MFSFVQNKGLEHVTLKLALVFFFVASCSINQGGNMPVDQFLSKSLQFNCVPKDDLAASEILQTAGIYTLSKGVLDGQYFLSNTRNNCAFELHTDAENAPKINLAGEMFLPFGSLEGARGTYLVQHGWFGSAAAGVLDMLYDECMAERGTNADAKACRQDSVQAAWSEIATFFLKVESENRTFAVYGGDKIERIF